MNTVTVDVGTYVPFKYLASTLTAVAADNAALNKVLKQYQTTPTYTPTTADIKSVLDVAVENGPALIANSTLLAQAYTMIMQIIFDQTATTTTTTQPASLLAEYLPRIATQLSTQPDADTKAKVALLQFAYGQIEPQNALLYPVVKALLTVLATTYQSPAQIQLETFRNIDNVLAVIPQQIANWSLPAVEIAHMLSLAYTYTTYTASPFAARALLAAAYQQLAELDQATLDANDLLVKSIVEPFLTLVFATQSYQVCLDEFLAYETVLESKFTQSEYFKQNFPLFFQLLEDFITTATLAQVESLAASPRWAETAKKYPQINVEALRTNLVSLLVADKIQAGKGYRFATLQTYLSLASEDEVEEYIVEATTHGQISTKIDQVEKIVHVSRVVPRKFNPEKSWGELQTRLQYFVKIISSFEKDYSKNEGKGIVA